MPNNSFKADAFGAALTPTLGLSREQQMFRKDLDPAVREELDQVIKGHCDALFEAMREADSQLTRHNIFLNSGATAALLAFVGAVPSTGWAIWPLTIFVAGIVSALIESRATVEAFKAMHGAALNIRSGFLRDEIDIHSLSIEMPAARKFTSISKWSGVFAQVAFIVGVMAAAYVFIANTAA